MTPRPAEGTASNEPPTALVRALRHLLRPLVRLLLSHRLTHPDLAAILKSVYLDVAGEEMAAAGQRRSASRLSLLTGVHRKDIRRLQEEAAGEYTPPASVALGARLVARWIGERDYLDGRKRPRPLPRSGPLSFEELVASVSTDIRPKAVLDEWLRLGIVEIDENERVRLRVEGFVPTRGFEETAHYFGRNLHDHMAAAAHNLAGERPPFLERSVYHTELSAEAASELAQLSEELGMQSLRAIDQRARELRSRDADDTTPRERLNFGIYCYRTDTPDPDADRRDE
jgi:hypothetical protein